MGENNVSNVANDHRKDLELIVEATSMIDSVKATALQRFLEKDNITKDDVNLAYKELMHSKWIISCQKRKDWCKLKDYLEYDIYGRGV